MLVAALLALVVPNEVLSEPIDGPVRPELQASLQPVMPLEQGWADPPMISRTRCWWWWLNGNVTKEAITRDLEAMRDKGIGGANIVDAAHASSGQNIKPQHGPDFASAEWVELFVHALSEADRLGLELGFNIQSGWNLGGPSVTPEQSAKKVVWSELTVEGGKGVHVEVPRPEARNGFYRDIMVLAFPQPDDPDSVARVDNFEQKAYHRYPGHFTAVDASHLVEVGEGKPAEVCIDPDSVVDLTSRVSDDMLSWDAPPGRWRVLRFGYTPSGAHVSTSSDNWKGPAIDYLDPAAFHKYCDDVLTPILEAAGPLVGRSLRFLHTDSWELGPVNWTPAMPFEFSARRGYDIYHFLPAIAGYAVGSREESNRFLNDFRRTIADLIADGKYQAFAHYAHQRGVGIHPESGGPHAAPVDALQNLGLSDIPMGEYWASSRTHRVRDFERLFVKQPASAAHVYGRRFVMAEAFTTIGPHWEKTPEDLKPDFDRVACEGLNMVMWHTFPCSPQEEGVPGIAYFAGTHLNPNVTWWRQADGFLGYLNRCQFMLQQGQPAADVLYFYGENIPSFVRLKREDPAGVLPEYDYDVANAQIVNQHARVEDGRILLDGGASYAVLVLPPSGHYGLATLQSIARLVGEGATVVGPKPEIPYGLGHAEEFTELADKLWGEGLIKDVAAVDALAGLGLAGDFSVESRGRPGAFDFIHRRTAVADVYFVANRRNRPATAACTFRSQADAPEVWDPVTGEIHAATGVERQGDRTRLTLDLAPHGSAFVVFPHAGGGPTPPVEATPARTVATLTGPWLVSFDPAWGGPASHEFEKLTDWSESSDPAIRYYSGAAVYRQTFDLPDGPTGDDYWIDLGRVEASARVTLNGQDLGVAWTRPFRLRAGNALRQGKNELEVEVVNLWPNRLIGDAQPDAPRRYTKTNIRRFTAESPLVPSGLLGPVRVLASGDGQLAQLPSDSAAPVSNN
ncbi:glycosyl hydrolase [Posidoniimonas corsicana]|uniref:glycosyl hydrolase n=1 Tax=Posidoniimonas corsicana TaxID=1938618 RepID=UPI001E5CC241|nr:glycosyl hydrolase [Posidoniimonas corsicana]